MLAMLRNYARLPRALWILFAATVVNSLGMFVFPFAALFLSTYQGLDVFWTGFFVTVLGLAYMPGGFIDGKLADHVGRKK